MSEGARTAGLGGFLGYSDPAGSLVCIVRPDGSAAALNIIPAEIYGTRVLRGVSCLWLGVPSKPGCVVLAWGGGNGGKMCCSCVSRRRGKELRAFKVYFSGISLLNWG